MRYHGGGSKGDSKVVNLTDSIIMGHHQGKYYQEEMLGVWDGENDEFFGECVDPKKPGGDPSGDFMKALKMLVWSHVAR